MIVAVQSPKIEELNLIRKGRELLRNPHGCLFASPISSGGDSYTASGKSFKVPLSEFYRRAECDDYSDIRKRTFRICKMKGWASAKSGDDHLRRRHPTRLAECGFNRATLCHLKAVLPLKRMLK